MLLSQTARPDLCSTSQSQLLQVGGLASAGILLFSGSCYAAALTQNRGNGKLAPFGGFSFIFAWLALAL